MGLEAVESSSIAEQEWDQVRDYESFWNGRVIHPPKTFAKIQEIALRSLGSLSQSDRTLSILDRNISELHLDESDDDAEFFDLPLFTLPHQLFLPSDSAIPQSHLFGSRRVYEISFRHGRVVINNGNNRLDAFICQKHKKKKGWLHKRKDDLKKGAKKVAHAVKKAAHEVKEAVKDVGKAVEKAAEEVKEFVVEHKTEIIVVAAVVVGVAVVAGVVALASAAAAAAAAAATAAPRKREEEEQTSQESPPNIPLGTMSNASQGLSSVPSTESYADHALLAGGDFRTLPTNNPFVLSESPQLSASSLSLTSQCPSSDKPKANTASFAFVDPDGPIRVYSPPLSDDAAARSLSSDKPKANTASFAFVDPDGPLRVYSAPLSDDEAARSLSFGESQRNVFPQAPSSFSIVDPDGPPRVYNIPYHESSRSKTFEIPGIQLARGAIGGINGIRNSIENAEAGANYVAQVSGNHKIQWVYNCSHSTVVDVAETIFLSYQGISAPAKLLQENWMQFHEQHKNDPDAKYLQLCHSQGSAHVRTALLNCSQEIRDRIIVVAIAPAAIVPRGLCFGSFNYASKRDPIPYAEAALYAGSDDSLIRELAQQKQEHLKELILLEPHPEAPLLDHGMESPTFKSVIERHLEIYINEFEAPK